MIQGEFLADRDQVIQATIRVIDSAKTECVGMGRQIAWIEIPAFRSVIQDAMRRQVSVRVIGVEEGDVDNFASLFSDLGVPVRYYEHGDVRVAIADSERAVLAFPSPCTGVHTNRAYNGLYIDDDRFVRWLKRRFDEIWDAATPPSRSFITRVRDDFLRNPGSIVAGLLGALIGAIATIIAVYLAK